MGLKHPRSSHYKHPIKPRHWTVAQVPELWPEAKKKTQTSVLQEIQEQFRSGQPCSLRFSRASPVPYFLLVKFRPVSYAADRILIRPAKPKRELQETPLLYSSSISTALKLSGQCTTEVSLAISLTVARRYIDYCSHKYEQHLKHPRHFSDILKSLNGMPIFTIGLSK